MKNTLENFIKSQDISSKENIIHMYFENGKHLSYDKNQYSSEAWLTLQNNLIKHNGEMIRCGAEEKEENFER